MTYHCPTCGYSVEKESFGYPVHCCATMVKGEGAPVITPGEQYRGKTIEEIHD